MIKTRNFIFTWNNYPTEFHDVLRKLDAKYLCYGKETAPTTKTPHLQGFVIFKNPRKVTGVRAILPGLHIEVAKGSASQCIIYCEKDGDFYEFGERPQTKKEQGDAEKERWEMAWALAKESDVEGIDADIRLRCYSTIKRIGEDFMQPVAPLDGTCGYWIHGESGAGKTRSVLAAYPDCYIKPRNSWWDGYQQEEVVVVDDLDKFDVKLGGKLKHWADFAPFVAERKGGSIRIRPGKLIVTSQYTIEEVWEDKETRQALMRRFVVIKKEKGQNIII